MSTGLEDAGTVLVVDDDADLRLLYQTCLAGAGYEVLLSKTTSEARDALDSANGGIDAIILDISLGGESGLDFLTSLTADYPGVPVMMSTSSKKVGDAIFALKNGAFDYLLKPVKQDEVLLATRNAVERGQMTRELTVRRALDPHTQLSEGEFVFASPAMREIVGVIDQVKDSSVPVLLEGETGTGKEVVARHVHRRSRRRDAPFIAVNCTTLPRELVESELFGHEKGSFTGASEHKLGKFQEAHGGTLFLDEVGELAPEVQVKLLRVLQENEVTPVGGKVHTVDARVVVATNRDLTQEVREGRFRSDLYFRLNVIRLVLPPLRDRPEEIPLLAIHLLDRFLQKEDLGDKTLSEAAIAELKSRRWPGNVRDLENALKRAALLSRAPIIEPSDIPPPELEEMQAGPGSPSPASSSAAIDPVGSLDDHARELMMRALAETKGNVSAAARRLGIGRATFYRRAKRYGLKL